MSHPFFDAGKYPWGRDDAQALKEQLRTVIPNVPDIVMLYEQSGGDRAVLDSNAAPDVVWYRALSLLANAGRLREFIEELEQIKRLEGNASFQAAIRAVREATPMPTIERESRRWPPIAWIAAVVVLVGGLIWGAAAIWSGILAGDDPTSPTSSSAPTPDPSPTIYPAVQVAIPSAVDWTPTGVSCADGDVLAITATGTILHELNPNSTVTPDGLRTPEGLPDPIYLRFNVPGVPDAATASLIGSLDKEQPFFVGSNLTYSCPRAGALFLGINDIGLEGNSGAWDVTIVKTDNPPLD